MTSSPNTFRTNHFGWVGLCCVLLLLAGMSCTLTFGQSSRLSDPPPVLSNTATPVPVDPDGWQTIAPGIERREIELPVGSLSRWAVVLRLDPSQVTFRVHYSPGAPRGLGEWRAALPDAALIVNGGFFDDSGRALGLLVADGQAFGQSFVGFGGMFQIGWDGMARVRSLASEPYEGESVVYAVQSFPMLVEPGGLQSPQGEGFDQRSRRTVIAQDTFGRVLIAVIPYGLVSFAELQQWLLGSDLQIYSAVALDGGRSTGLDVQTTTVTESYPSVSALPSVIGVHERVVRQHD